jgi:nucleotidyltransferase/DNA polymerase involved in DNA repair
MEDRGVDEVYIDFTDVPGGQREGGRVLARLIQKSIFDATGLTCSVGVAPNKLLAKMASEFNKPNGISIVHDDDLQTKIWPLACRKINGIGPKADESCRPRHPHHWRSRHARPAVAGRPLRQELRRLDARRRLGPRRPPGGDRERAGQR